MSNYVKGKDKNQILNEMYGTAQPGSVTHEQQKMGIIVRSVEDLEESLKSLEGSMNRNAESSTDLAKKVFWLNVVLTVATVVGTAFAGYQVLQKRDQKGQTRLKLRSYRTFNRV